MTTQTRPDELIRILRPEFVTKAGGVPGGGGSCVVHTCGATGWRAAGGTIARTLVHEVAFQLTADGNARGASAIDLQKDHWVGWGGTDVAAAPFSAILTNEDNVIEDDCDYSVIIGTWNEIRGGSAHNAIYGWNIEIFGGSFSNSVFGDSHDLDDSDYCLVAGSTHDLDGAFGCIVLGEGNDVIENVHDYPTYCVSLGILNTLEGNTFNCFQWGESNKMYALGSVANEIVWIATQFGYRHYAQNVQSSFQFGRDTKNYLPDADVDGEYYTGRILLNGDSANANPSDGTGEVGGFNQDSWFSQNDIITTWNVAWTTERFEFPIIEDSIWTFLIYVSATERGCANSHSWKIEGVIENDGGVTTMLASTVTNIYRDVATKECQVVADNANDRLAVQFRDTAGPDATWTNVQISMFTIEVGAEV